MTTCKHDYKMAGEDVLNDVVWTNPSHDKSNLEDGIFHIQFNCSKCRKYIFKHYSFSGASNHIT